MPKTDTQHEAGASLKRASVDKVTIQWLNDSDPDLSWLKQFEDSTDPEEQKYAEQDKERLENYGRTWEMLGCTVKAEVSYSIGCGSRRLEWFTSVGLWGIESDSDREYLTEVENEQLADLADHLSHFGIEISAEQLRELAN